MAKFNFKFKPKKIHIYSNNSFKIKKHSLHIQFYGIPVQLNYNIKWHYSFGTLFSSGESGAHSENVNTIKLKTRFDVVKLSNLNIDSATCQHTNRLYFEHWQTSYKS